MEYEIAGGLRGGFSTDLACERHRADTALEGVDYRKEYSPGGTWERIKITTEEGARSIGRPMGVYDTLNLSRMDTLDYDALDDATEEVAKELCRLCDRNRVLPERILVVGLGNGELTPDAVGPASASVVEATMHIRTFDENMFTALECSEIAVICPGVTAKSGIESADVVEGVSKRVLPDVILAIDAIAARSPMRLGTTIQFSDTGILPGSGLGNNRRAINEELLGVPVIAIGVPTVMDSRLFVSENGEVGASAVSGMFVSPKEIDGIVRSAGRIIGNGINQAFGIST